MTKQKQNTLPAEAPVRDFEGRMERLQVIVESLEQGDSTLEKGMKLYKEGLALVHSCRKELQEAKHEITVYSEGGFQEYAQEADPDPTEEADGGE